MFMKCWHIHNEVLHLDLNFGVFMRNSVEVW